MIIVEMHQNVNKVFMIKIIRYKRKQELSDIKHSSQAQAKVIRPKLVILKQLLKYVK